MGIKSDFMFEDITWLMPSIDVQTVLEQLEVKVASISGSEVRALCPDHYLYVGKESSHPNWFLNTETGQTYCFTEPRGSNLVYTASRLLSCSPKQAAEWLAGREVGGLDNLRMSRVKQAMERLKVIEDDTDEEHTVAGLHSIEEELKQGVMYKDGYAYFVQPPPPKSATNIKPETVRHFRVFQRRWGFYTNRVIAPVYTKGELLGFVATDILGKQRWLECHPTETEKEYRKVRYPSNMPIQRCLFGYDEVSDGPQCLILTEGIREVMKLWQEGYTDSVAQLGPNLHDPQMELLSERHPKNIFLMYDGDAAGRGMTEKVAKKLLHSPMCSVYDVNLPEGMDPKVYTASDFKVFLRRAKKLEK